MSLEQKKKKHKEKMEEFDHLQEKRANLLKEGKYREANEVWRKLIDFKFD
jgi:hypothetical protein